MPSTNKTPNYNLSQYVTGDKQTMADYNGDNSKIDAAVGSLDAAVGAHTAENANKHIRESGTNESGSYIKFDDGTQICWINWELGSITIDSMAVSPAYSWGFPSSFIGNPSVQISNSSVNSNWIRSNFTTVTSTVLDGVQLFNTFTNSITNNHTLHVLAIGRWK